MLRIGRRKEAFSPPSLASEPRTFPSERWWSHPEEAPRPPGFSSKPMIAILAPLCLTLKSCSAPSLRVSVSDMDHAGDLVERSLSQLRANGYGRPFLHHHIIHLFFCCSLCDDDDGYYFIYFFFLLIIILLFFLSCSSSYWPS